MRRCLFRYFSLIFSFVLLLHTKPVRSSTIYFAVLSSGSCDQYKYLLLIIESALADGKTIPNKNVTPKTPPDLNPILKKAKRDYNEGNYPVSLKNALLAEYIAQSHHNDTSLADARNLIALLYFVREKYAEAFPYLTYAAAVNRKYGKLYRLATNQLNLSMYFADKKQYQKAIKYADSSLQLSIRVKKPDMVAMAANHLGEYYALAGKEQKAVACYESVITNKNFQSNWENSFAYTRLARLRLAHHDNEQAIKFATIAFELAKKAKTKWDAQQALDLLYKAYQRSGDYHKAFDYLNIYKNYSDSLFNDKKEQEINFLLLKEKEAENRDLKRRNSIDQQHQKINQMVILIVSLVTVLLLAVLTLLYKRFVRSRKYNTALRFKSEKIEQKSNLISEQNLNLNQLNYTKDQLFSIIGHDLRSPFASILTALELFQSGDFDTEEINELAGKLHEQVSVTTKMLDNLLLWGSNQLGGLQTYHQTIDLAATISGVVEVLKPVAGLKQITISFVPLPNAFISADNDQVKVIIQNLVANAIKFTGKGGEVDVSLTNNQDQIELAVRDNGVGMAPDTLHQLLRYGGKRVSTSGTTGERGIGLGLLLVKDFAEQNGAKIKVQSVQGEGTTFFVAFAKVKS
jgi:signal transduction histidine kinase